jgi:hypothetical protein
MHRLHRDASIFCAFTKIQERHKGQFANGRRSYQKKIHSASGKQILICGYFMGKNSYTDCPYAVLYTQSSPYNLNNKQP